MNCFNPDEAIKEFLKNHDVTNNSRAVYKYTINYFFKWLVKQGRDTTRPTRADLIEYKAGIRETLTPNTVGLYIASVKTFFRYLSNEGLYDNIARGIKTISKTHTFAKDPLMVKDIKKLLSFAKKTIIDHRDYLIISLMYHNGLRIIEVSRLRYRDINLDRKEIWIRGKGRTVTESVTINNAVCQAIEDYTQAKIDAGNNIDLSDFLINTHSWHNNPQKQFSPRYISVIVANRLKQAGLKTNRVTGHSLRHSAAVHMINEGKFDLYAVQLFLRHKDSNKTRIYTKYAEKVKLQNNQPTNFLESYLNKH
jgi:site-specific recombinase XerD